MAVISFGARFPLLANGGEPAAPLESQGKRRKVEEASPFKMALREEVARTIQLPHVLVGIITDYLKVFDPAFKREYSVEAGRQKLQTKLLSEDEIDKLQPGSSEGRLVEVLPYTYNYYVRVLSSKGDYLQEYIQEDLYNLPMESEENRYMRLFPKTQKVVVELRSRGYDVSIVDDMAELEKENPHNPHPTS